MLEGLLSLLLAGIPRPPVMHIWKIFTCLWFRKDSLVSPSQLFLSCHPILLLNKWLLTFKPHSFPILANHRALLFYFLQLLHAKLSFHMLSNHNLHAIAKKYVMLSSLSSHSLVFVPHETDLRLHQFNKQLISTPRIEFEVHLTLYTFFLTCNSNDFFL